MAANYWASTQRRHWLFSRESLAEQRRPMEEEDSTLIQQYPLPERRHMSFFFNSQLAKLGKRMNVRQQALATAQVYIKRFYSKVEIRRTNPYLVLTTALYLACKMEECPQHIRVVVSEARQLWPDFIITDVSKLGECEFYLISEMNSQLIIHHPYRTLHELQKTLNMAVEETQLAWSIINDHYLTDLPLLVPPHVVAVTAIFLALPLKPAHAGLQAAMTNQASQGGSSQVSKEALPSVSGISQAHQKKVQNMVNWLAEGEIGIQAVIECSQEIISLYEVWNVSVEKDCKEQISRFVKARGLDK